MAIQTVSQIYNPVTGVFGTGNVQFFSASGAWVVPQGIGKVRVRMWGAGGASNVNSSNYGGGGGGGFAMKTIYDLTGVASVPVSVGSGALTSNYGSGSTLQAGSSSFGSYCSATGGYYASVGAAPFNTGGTGVGGDINNTGGTGSYNSSVNNASGGGGAASYFGNGADAILTINQPSPSRGGGGGGNGYENTSTSSSTGGSGFMTSGGVNIASGTSFQAVLPQAMPTQTGFSIDFIGCGGGGAPKQSGVNGGGGGWNCAGGFPGGGSAFASSGLTSAGGLVIVEW
jgi:hypothetical protein